MNDQNIGERFDIVNAGREPDNNINNTTLDSNLTPDHITLGALQENNKSTDEIGKVENSMTQPIPDDIPIGKNIEIVDSLDELVTNQAQKGEGTSSDSSLIKNTGLLAELLNREDSAILRARWIEIQTKFIDDPRSAVQQADGLVFEVVEKITQLFSDERRTLESQWKEGNDVSTEDLRKALQHYRSFFNRLVV